MKIYLGTDHAGFELKEIIKDFLTKEGKEVIDLGAYTYNPDDDYPDFIKPVAEAVSKDKEYMAIIFGYSGEGEAMVANRFSGVRAAVYNGGSEEILKLSREHNNANILSIGAHFIDKDKVASIVKMWLETPFSNDERHVRRLSKI